MKTYIKPNTLVCLLQTKQTIMTLSGTMGEYNGQTLKQDRYRLWGDEEEDED